MPRCRRPTGLLPLLVLAAVVGACGDASGPELEPVAVVLPDTVRLDAIRDSVRLPAEVVYAGGHREPLAGGEWAGHGGDAAVLFPDGWVWTQGPGAFTATVGYGAHTASTRVVIQREGRILLTFDDGWRSARTVALPALAAAGLRASVAVVTETVGWPAFVGLADLQALHEAGWALVSHSVTHANLPTLSAAELETELAASRAWLVDRGFRVGDVFIVPYHDWGERERDAIRRHYAAARGATADATWPAFVAEWRPEDPYGITTLDASALLRTPDGRDQLMAWVRHAIDEGLLLDLMFHDVPPEDEDAFLALVDRLGDVRDRVFTWADLYPLPADGS